VKLGPTAINLLAHQLRLLAHEGLPFQVPFVLARQRIDSTTFRSRTIALVT
jgi:hypothetical protein